MNYSHAGHDRKARHTSVSKSNSSDKKRALTSEERRQRENASLNRTDKTDSTKRKRVLTPEEKRQRESASLNRTAKSGSAKKKRVLTPEEKRLREARIARKRAEEEAQKFSSMKTKAVEKDRDRKIRQQERARKRKVQLIIRIAITVILIVAAIMAMAFINRTIKQRELEPDGGAGTNILQAAEEANQKDPSGGSKDNSSGSAQDGSISSGAADGMQNQTDTNPADATVQTNPAGETGDISLCMIGDVILHQRVLDASATASGYDFNNLFANVTQEVKNYDIKIVNQETILGGPALEYTGYPAFNSPFEEADAIVNAGFNVVLQATNHTLDKGQPAVQNCLNYWNNTYPQTAVLGIHDAMEPSQDIYVFEKNGMKIAILNYTYGSNLYEEEIASGELAGEVNILDSQKVYSDIQRAKEMADYVIVCPHWGVENDHEINSDQENWTQSFLQWGVNLVIGTHSHVIQPIEMLTGTDGHQMLVYYSLGNFLSNQSERAGNVGGFAQVVIGKNDQGQVVTKEYGIRPVVCHEGDDGESYTTYFLDEYTEDMAARNNVLSSDPEFSYSYCYEITQQVFGGIGKLS